MNVLSFNARYWVSLHALAARAVEPLVEALHKSSWTDEIFERPKILLYYFKDRGFRALRHELFRICNQMSEVDSYWSLDRDVVVRNDDLEYSSKPAIPSMVTVLLYLPGYIHGGSGGKKA